MPSIYRCWYCMGQRLSMLRRETDSFTVAPRSSKTTSCAQECKLLLETHQTRAPMRARFRPCPCAAKCPEPVPLSISPCRFFHRGIGSLDEGATRVYPRLHSDPWIDSRSCCPSVYPQTNATGGHTWGCRNGVAKKALAILLFPNTTPRDELSSSAGFHQCAIRCSIPHIHYGHSRRSRPNRGRDGAYGRGRVRSCRPLTRSVQRGGALVAWLPVTPRF